RKWDERERENEDRRRSAEGTGRQREEVERQEGVREQKDGQREAGPTRGSYTASAAPAGNSTFVRVVDAGSQTEPSYVSSAVQAVVEVSSKSTATSPTLTPRPQSWLDPELDLPPDLSFHVRASGTRYVSLKNELGPKVNPDSVCRSSHASATKARTKCPSYKSPHQNVCHIEIELCNKSSLSKGHPLQSSVCEADPAGHVRVALPGATEIDSKSSLTQSDPELKQEAKSGDQTETRPPPGVVREEQAETGPPPGVVWDEQGMTWEVYGAAVDMESLGFAIQNHLQRRIQEHVRHIGVLRKSISLSEHSALAGKKKKRRNVFRALFHTPACCSRTTAEMVQ
ncbi:uncharacterized protein LOC143498962, partial [Brachyhypopomus gauderio]|uniref:uncharacterized protein LOC143498962 n=1 Tax=Brachyhypopomus gauderio TaxID=698409 RepID=UPI00404311DA